MNLKKVLFITLIIVIIFLVFFLIPSENIIKNFGKAVIVHTRSQLLIKSKEPIPTPTPEVTPEEGGMRTRGISHAKPGKPSFIESNFTVDPLSISVSLKQGESIVEILKITNIGDTPLNITLVPDAIQWFITLSEQSFYLQPGYSNTLNLTIFAAENEVPGTYIGKIIVEGDGASQIVSLTIQIKEKTQFEMPALKFNWQPILLYLLTLLLYIILVIVIVKEYRKKSKETIQEEHLSTEHPGLEQLNLDLHVCKKCGTTLKGKKNFCAKCGTKHL